MIRKGTGNKTGEVLFGLIGHPLGHSFSAAYFNGKFRREGLVGHRYLLLDTDCPEKDLPVLKKDKRYRGFNVTIPYKQILLPFLDRLSPEAEAIGAVNTINVEKNGEWTGYNTDCTGFLQSLLPLLANRFDPKTDLALVLGNGGASQAVQYALGRLDIPYVLVCRNPLHAVRHKSFAPQRTCLYRDLDRDTVASCRLIVNTTKLGMFPDTRTFPDIPYAAVGSGHTVFDLVYNPEKTLLMERCQERGAVVKNGLEMLHRQADAAWDIWQESR